MKIHNLMEDIVYSCLKDLLVKRPDLKHIDERHLSDIMAITLNQLDPRYVASDKGEVIAKTQLRAQKESDVYRELSYAINKILHSPRKSDFVKESGENATSV